MRIIHYLLLTTGCGGGLMGTDLDPADITAYRDAVDGMASASTTYRAAMMEPSMTVAGCAGVHDRYEQEVRPLIEHVMERAAAMDGFMGSHHGAGVEDMQCVASAMMRELDMHAAIACSWPDLDGDRSEAARHVDAMTRYTDHTRTRCSEMLDGLAGRGWRWDVMMSGCGCTMMGCDDDDPMPGGSRPLQ